MTDPESRYFNGGKVYQFHKAPDTETVNLLVEVGDIVAASDPIVLQQAPTDYESARASLLNAAAQTILSVKALRKARRLSE